MIREGRQSPRCRNESEAIDCRCGGDERVGSCELISHDSEVCCIVRELLAVEGVLAIVGRASRCSDHDRRSPAKSAPREPIRLSGCLRLEGSANDGATAAHALGAERRGPTLTQ